MSFPIPPLHPTPNVIYNTMLLYHSSSHPPNEAHAPKKKYTPPELVQLYPRNDPIWVGVVPAGDEGIVIVTDVTIMVYTLG